MKKLVLLRPSSNIEVAPPPLGLMYIAAYLREKEESYYNIKIIDGRNLIWTKEKIVSVVKDEDPDYIGISSMNAEAAESIDVLTSIKKSLKVPVIMGGPYTTCNIDNAFKNDLDYAVIGEGEATFLELLKTIDKGEDLSSVKGIAYVKNKQIKYTGSRPFIEDISSIPFPAWDLINLNNYFYGKKRALENPVQIFKKAVPVLSSRGCPYKCTYCHDIFGKRFRKRSSENIIKELKFLISTYGIKEIEFLDDIFNFDKDRAKDICRQIIEEKLNLKFCFSNGLRIECMDDEFLDLLVQAGCYRINYGIESGNARIQSLMKKKLNLDKAKEVIHKTVKKKIMTGGFFMLGFQGETREEMMETISFAINSPLHTAVFSIVTPYPNTEMFNMAKFAGINVNINFGTVMKVTLNLSKVNNDELASLVNYAYKEFYFSWKRILNIFLVTRNKFSLASNFFEVFRVSYLKKELYQQNV